MIRTMILAAGALCLMLGGCAGPAPAETSSPNSVPVETAPLPTEAAPVEALPLSTVKEASAEAFAEAGLPLMEPFGAENVVYEWDGEVAQVRFTMAGVEQVFRGGWNKADVERDYPLTEEGCTICACGAYYSQETEERTYEDGGKAALWSFGERYFSLYTAPHEENDGMIADPFTLGQYAANQLDERTWAGTMGADGNFFPEQVDAELILTDVTASGLTLQVENHREGDILDHGVDYILWKLVGGEWRQIPDGKPGAPIEEGSSMGYHEDQILNLDWTWRYGELTPGSYRIAKGVAWKSGAETTAYADFTLE